MDGYYLRLKWLPKNEDELLAAFRDGTLDERNWCDVKREIDTNLELARDLTSFSVDGGIVVVGIDEKTPETPLNALPLNGLCERIEQIARSRVDPPLQVACTPIGSGAGDGSGYVIVRVPASALAPHQVQSVYYGRGDKTKIRLSDAEVARLHRRRDEWNQDARELLDLHIAADPFAEAQAAPHVFFVARPVGGWPEMCRDLAGAADWREKLRALVSGIALDETLRAMRARMFPGQPGSGFLGNLTQTGRTERGAILANQALPLAAQGGAGWHSMALEIGEDGELRFLYTGAGETAEFNGIPRTYLYPEAVAFIVRDMLALARQVSGQSGHAAMWELGLAVTGISGARAKATHIAFSGLHEYPGSAYRQTARATVLDLEKIPGTITARLTGRLYRTLDLPSQGWLTIPLEDPDAETEQETGQQ